MRLRVLGCSGTFPSSSCSSSGYVLEDPSASIWIDAGTGTFQALEHAIDHADIDAFILTHIHSDHCLDVFPFYYARRFDVRLEERLPFYCPEGSETHLSHLLVGDGACTLSHIFDFREVKPGDEIEVNGVKCTFMLTQHPVPTHAVRCESEAGTFTFSADTGPDTELDRFAYESDVFLCDATWQHNGLGPPLHLSAMQAAEIAKRAEVRSLVLTHLFPTLDPARSVEEAEAVAGDIVVRAAFQNGVFDFATRDWIDNP